MYLSKIFFRIAVPKYKIQCEAFSFIDNEHPEQNTEKVSRNTEHVMK